MRWSAINRCNADTQLLIANLRLKTSALWYVFAGSVDGLIGIERRGRSVAGIDIMLEVGA